MPTYAMSVHVLFGDGHPQSCFDARCFKPLRSRPFLIRLIGTHKPRGFIFPL